MIDTKTEMVIFESIRRQSSKLECKILGLNGVADHVHVAVCIPPKLAISTWVKTVKGTSAHEVNAMFPNLDTHFMWQDSYGVLSFGKKNLESVLAYIAQQKEHHRNNQLQAYLEQIDDVDNLPF